MLAKLAALVLLSSFLAKADIVGKEVTYTADSLSMKGYLVYDDTFKGKMPGVLVIPEWWGNNDYTRKRAEMLARLGYVALAVDMYGKGRLADNPEDAGRLAGEVMKDQLAVKTRFIAAMNFLKSDEHTDTSKIGAVGYCFGGGVVLGMARTDVGLKAAVCFHGSLATQHPAEKGNKTKILVCNGAADKLVPAKDIKKFKSEMKSAGIDFRFVNFPGALHAFSNPAATDLGKKFNMPIAYNPDADEKSWLEMKKWLKRSFK